MTKVCNRFKALSGTKCMFCGMDYSFHLTVDGIKVITKPGWITKDKYIMNYKTRYRRN
jgi:hypothetical protein